MFLCLSIFVEEWRVRLCLPRRQFGLWPPCTAAA